MILKKPAITKSTRIGVLCGGLSSEREVSLRSGKNCSEALIRLGYDQTTLIDVDRQIDSVLTRNPIDVAFLALHGRYGEDGAIQGLLEVKGIAYTGNRLATSAITMNKDLTKRLLAQAGLPVLPSTLFTSENGNTQTSPAFKTMVAQQRYPVMVKPLGEGSSVGMSRVETEEQLAEALEKAGHFSATVMIEPYITGKSITVGVVDIDGVPTVTPILGFKTKTDWYDEAAKYTQGLTEFVLPADLSPKTTQAIQETTLKAHNALGCHGLSRTDFMVDADNNFYILEVNTIPGMTDLSDLPAQVQAMGISYDTLVDHILQTARY